MTRTLIAPSHVSMGVGNILLWMLVLGLAAGLFFVYQSKPTKAIPWTDVAFVAPAANFGVAGTGTSAGVFDYGTCQYCKDVNGVVKLRGLLKITGSLGSTVQFKLPATCAPKVRNELIFATASNDAFGSVRIRGTGEFIVWKGAAWVSLDGIQFETE
jgi:hypothetical protein